MGLSIDEREPAFRALYAAHFDAVLGYAVRRCDRPEDAAEVTADTFLVAWRRLAHVPQGPELRPWLYGVARRVLANHRRGERRRSALGDRLRRELTASVPDQSEDVVQRADVTAAMQRLSARDQEVLELHLWEGLESREIAAVLGLSAAVVRPRLSRARGRLRELVGDTGHHPRNDPGNDRGNAAGKAGGKAGGNAAGDDAGNDPGADGHLPSTTPQLVRKEQ